MPVLRDAALPRVLVQLPVCDEGDLALRVLQAAARLDWPRDRLEIQLLDDGTTELHEALCEQARRAVPDDVNSSVLRRGERVGFKAGNLAFGLHHSDAPYVAIFDADFVPPPDFLRRTVPALVADPGLAFVQARWGHANRSRNWLTRAQGVLLDGHFAVEQEARYPRRAADLVQRHRRRLEPQGDRAWRRLDRRHADRGSRSYHALRIEGLARRDDRPIWSSRRIAANRGRLAGAAGALDQRPCAGRAQTAAKDPGEPRCPLWKKTGDDVSDVPVRFLHCSQPSAPRSASH